mmetsp:Transcript_4905/g.12599  ORF Transcript_4905/g.12599 Transcript_4905/m.12599 type:complete len:239 (+) Transcript_4905:776-1492(+)
MHFEFLQLHPFVCAPSSCSRLTLSVKAWLFRSRMLLRASSRWVSLSALLRHSLHLQLSRQNWPAEKQSQYSLMHLECLQLHVRGLHLPFSLPRSRFGLSACAPAAIGGGRAGAGCFESGEGAVLGLVLAPGRPSDKRKASFKEFGVPSIGTGVPSQPASSVPRMAGSSWNMIHGSSWPQCAAWLGVRSGVHAALPVPRWSSAATWSHSNCRRRLFIVCLRCSASPPGEVSGLRPRCVG